MISAPTCPFCENQTVLRKAPAPSNLFRIFDCPVCHAELRQNFSRELEAAPEEEAPKQEPNDCPDCAFSDIHCMVCDDSICEKHVRTFEKYAGYLSPDLHSQLVAEYGNAVYCPLCFQNAFNRFTMSIKSGKTKEKKPSFYNLPVITFLLIVLFIIMI